MNAIHVHLALNHVPVIGLVIGILLLALAVAFKSLELTRVSLGMMVGLALVGGLVYLTGEPAEELAMRLPGVAESMVERHEEAALVATVLLGVLGLVAAGGLIALRSRSGAHRRLPLFVLIVALIPAGAMAYTAYLGGQIRHEEIRPGFVPAEAASVETTD